MPRAASSPASAWIVALIAATTVLAGLPTAGASHALEQASNDPASPVDAEGSIPPIIDPPPSEGTPSLTDDLLVIPYAPERTLAGESFSVGIHVENNYTAFVPVTVEHGVSTGSICSITSSAASGGTDLRSREYLLGPDDPGRESRGVTDLLPSDTMSMDLDVKAKAPGTCKIKVEVAVKLVGDTQIQLKERLLDVIVEKPDNKVYMGELAVPSAGRCGLKNVVKAENPDATQKAMEGQVKIVGTASWTEQCPDHTDWGWFLIEKKDANGDWVVVATDSIENDGADGVVYKEDLDPGTYEFRFRGIYNGFFIAQPSCISALIGTAVSSAAYYFTTGPGVAVANAIFNIPEVYDRCWPPPDLSQASYVVEVEVIDPDESAAKLLGLVTGAVDDPPDVCQKPVNCDIFGQVCTSTGCVPDACETIDCSPDPCADKVNCPRILESHGPS